MKIVLNEVNLDDVFYRDVISLSELKVSEFY